MVPEVVGAPVDAPEDILDAFAAAWTVLSRVLLAPPTEVTLGTLRDPEMLADWPLSGDAHTERGLALLRGSTEDEGAVKDDHRQLFVGPDKLPAAPWESVHRSPEGLTFEEETIAVREAYAEFGLAAPQLNREPDDHVGLELEFLATLAVRAMDDPEQAGRYVTAISEFHRDHIDQWVPKLAGLIEASAETDLYRGIGALLAGAAEQGSRVFAGSVQEA